MTAGPQRREESAPMLADTSSSSKVKYVDARYFYNLVIRGGVLPQLPHQPQLQHPHHQPPQTEHVLLDLRTKEEYDRSHINTAQRINPSPSFCKPHNTHNTHHHLLTVFAPGTTRFKDEYGFEGVHIVIAYQSASVATAVAAATHSSSHGLEYFERKKEGSEI